MPITESKPQSHFFIEPGGLSQNINQCFGPITGNEENEFRLTAKFSCSSPLKAYSICKGVILIQPQYGDTTKVNLILRPYIQPYPGLDVKYFIYRGLQKSDFFTNDTEPKVIPVINNVTSDFVNKINSDFDDFYSDTLIDQTGTVIPKPLFLAKFISYDPLLNGTTLLTDLFFKKSELTTVGGSTQETHSFELPLIDAGKSLGNFDIGESGIDIILNYGDYKNDFDNGDFVFDLNYSRSVESKIVLAGTEAEKKMQREQITQFIDIAAFYGLYANQGAVKAYIGNTFVEKEGAGIYTDLLSSFITKNNWYIYIQGDRTRSYNYYENYVIDASGSDDIKIGISENTLAPLKYQTNKWPLLINIQQQTYTDGRNGVYLQFVTDNNKNAVLFGQLGKIENAQQNNFCDPDYIKDSPASDGNYGNLTKVIKIATAAAADGNNIASLSILIYQGISYPYVAGQAEDANSQLVDIYSQPNFFDDVFDLVKSSPLVQSPNGNTPSKITSQKLKLINYFYDKKQWGVSAVQTLTVEDSIQTGDILNSQLDRVIYLSETVNILNDAVAVDGKVTSDTKTSSTLNKSSSPSQTYLLPNPYYYELNFFTEGTAQLKGLLLKVLDNSIPSKIVVGITKEENDRLRTLITPGKTNPRLFLVDLFTDGNNLVSVENIEYQKYRLGLVAEHGGKLELLMPASEIFIYSLDRKYHFSELYSRYMQDYKTILDNLIINTTE